MEYNASTGFLLREETVPTENKWTLQRFLNAKIHLFSLVSSSKIVL